MPGRSIPVSISPLSHTSMMRACSPKQNRHKKRDDCSEANPPGEFHYREPARLRISSRSETPRHIVRQPPQNCYDDHKNGEPTRGPPDGAQALLIRGVAINISFVPIASKAGGQRVQGGAERAHRRGENSCNQEAAQADWHFVKDEMAERFVRRFGESGIGMRLVIGPE